MSHDRWEDSLEELCTSPEEAADLKETASLFAQLPETHYSTSFQEKLKHDLLLRAAQQGKKRQQSGRIHSILERMGRSRSLGLAAAAVLIIFLAGSVLNNALTDPTKPKVDGQDHQQGPLISDAGDYSPHDSEITPMETETDLDLHKDTGTEKEPPQNGAMEGVAEEPGDPDFTPASETQTDPDKPEQQQTDEPAATPAEEQEEQTDIQPDEEVVPSLPDEPDFEVYKNRRTFTLAGNIVLNYGPAVDEPHLVEDVQYNWQPNKIVLAAENGYEFGTVQWARQLLTDEGFRVNSLDGIEIKMQETTQGVYAEILYPVSPALVLHVHEEKGILNYYYEEKGDVAAKGYYALLTPTKALEQQRQLKSSVDGQQLNFSFRSVKLTYHDFLVEKDGTAKKIRLPAYCFTGDEKHQGKEAITFYVPAVKR